jgi:glucosyl-dolichyl phosphate glucuronosyltransferase
MTTISVIIATYNRYESLQKTLDSLLQQNDPGTFDYEIIIVDNKSTDKTKELVLDYISKFNNRLRYAFEPQQGLSNARNKGISEAKGEIIAFTDDDVTVEQNWLSSLVECFNKYDCDGIGGRVLPIYPENTPLWVRQNPVQIAGVVVIYDQGVTACPADETIERFIGANCAFKKNVFKDCGLYRTDLGAGTPIMLGEDDEFYFRLLHNKKKLYYCPQAIIRHPVDLNRLSFKKTAIWHMALGRYQAYRQIEQGRDKFIFYFGAPRYLFRDIIVNFLKLLVLFGDRFSFWNAYRRLFCDIGMVQQYQISTREKKNA